MDLIGKAVWYIETHSEGEITLDTVADAAGLSKFQLVRAFGTRCGLSVMRYLRARRLSEAAKRLATGEEGILNVALAAGYNSHEAFTRAFKDQFGLTPEVIRKARSLDGIKLVEPLKMQETLSSLPEPRIEHGDAMLLVGLRKRYSQATSPEIPSQWQAFEPHIGSIDKQIEKVTYGILCNSDDDGTIDYCTAVRVKDFADIPKGLDGLRVSPQTYAVFRHEGHVSEIRRTWKTIFGPWMSTTPHKLVDAPQFERYGPSFDPRTGFGEIEIWIPVEA
ncbi:AraC family transcriptional regulator [Oryzibacter oryziterrae]|uniref:AraC family transcriptional regulator n=1 Tax=Oryzibacter oryziterrae TaxID=2766474 RepID=UPI001F16B2A2|nr:AraC family transcriptional regulator [Oryzibacter oryziterrae]